MKFIYAWPRSLISSDCIGSKISDSFHISTFPELGSPSLSSQDGTQSSLALRNQARAAFYYLSMCTEGKISSKKPHPFERDEGVFLYAQNLSQGQLHENLSFKIRIVFGEDINKHVVTSVNTDIGPSSKSPNGTILQSRQRNLVEVELILWGVEGLVMTSQGHCLHAVMRKAFKITWRSHRVKDLCGKDCVANGNTSQVTNLIKMGVERPLSSDRAKLRQLVEGKSSSVERQKRQWTVRRSNRHASQNRSRGELSV